MSVNHCSHSSLQLYTSVIGRGLLTILQYCYRIQLTSVNVSLEVYMALGTCISGVGPLAMQQCLRIAHEMLT